MKKLLLSITALGLILFCGMTVATAENTLLAQKALASTVELDMARAYGSGFLVAPGRVATNLHVIHGSITGTAKLVGQTNSFQIKGYTAVNAKQDLIILDVPGLDAPSLRLGDSDSVKIGETVYAVGNPHGFEGTFSEGNISSIRKDDNGRLLQITAPISPGSSGGPVLNKDGEVIGVSVAVGPGQNLNFAIPANDLKSLREKQFPSPNYLEVSRLGRINSSDFEWLDPNYPSYRFSLENIGRQNVKNIYCLTIFLDENQRIIGMDTIKVPEIDAGKKKEVIYKNIFTYKSGEESEELQRILSITNDDDFRARVLSQQLIEESKIILERVKIRFLLTNDEAPVLARQYIEDFKEINDYNFLAPDVRQMSTSRAVIILDYDMEPNFNLVGSRP